MSRSLIDLDALVAHLADLPAEQLRPLAEALTAAAGPAPSVAVVEVSPWMDADEVAAYLRCTRRRVYDLVADGRLSRCGDGRRLLVAREEVRALVAAGDGPPRRRAVGHGVDPRGRGSSVASLDAHRNRDR